MKAFSRSVTSYRFMWLLVMFDLPVVTPRERRAATKFRNWLLDQGYEMSQFSVYLRTCVGKEQVGRRLRDIGRNVPNRGRVHVISITDRQYELMARFRGQDRDRRSRSPAQLELF